MMKEYEIGEVTDSGWIVIDKWMEIKYKMKRRVRIADHHVKYGGKCGWYIGDSSSPYGCGIRLDGDSEYQLRSFSSCDIIFIDEDK